MNALAIAVLTRSTKFALRVVIDNADQTARPILLQGLPVEANAAPSC